jgi:hypothetical protein
MPTLENVSPNPRIFALHVSESGDGKSDAAASYPGPFHQWDFDGRNEALLSKVKPRGPLEPKDVSFTRFYPKNGYEPFQDELNILEMQRISRQFPYGTCELASITSFNRALIVSSHNIQKGKMIGKLRMSGPGDFNFEVSGMAQLMDQLEIFPCNVIVSAHIIDKWGKPDTGNPEKDQYAANEKIGEKIALRDQPGAVLPSMFSNVFRFSRKVVSGQMKYYVNFATDLAKNSFGIPPGEHDITGKMFYPYLQDLIKQIREGSFKPPSVNAGMPF